MISDLNEKIGKVNKIVCNLPFGKQFNPNVNFFNFYSKLLKSWHNILLSGGEMILLTTQKQALCKASKEANFSIKKISQIDVQGLKAGIFKLQLNDCS